MLNNNETQSRIAAQLLRAALANLDSQRQNALATLDIYLHVPAGVGDHPNLVAEIVTATKALAEAEDGIAALERHFLTTEEEAISSALFTEGEPDVDP